MTTFNAPNPPTQDLQGMQQKLRTRIGRLGSRLRIQIGFDAVVRCMAVMLGLLALSVVLDFWLELSRPMRLFYWLITLAAGAHFIYHYGVKPLRSRLDPVALAQAVDLAKGHEGSNQLAPRVATVLQLPGHLGDDAALSSQMIRDAVDRSYKSLEDTDFTGALSGKHTMQCLVVLIAAVLIPGTIGGVMNGIGENVLGTWAQRWLTLSDTPYPRNTSIQVMGLSDDGTLIIPAGENATLRATITTKDGKAIDEARLTISPEGGKQRTEPLAKFDEQDFRLDLSPMTETATATLRAGDQSLRFEILPAARPRLTGLKLTHTHPALPDEKKTIDFNGAEGEVSLLELNEIELALTANVAIAQARYADDGIEGEPEKALPPIERVSANTFSIRWTHKDDQRLRIELVSEQAGLVSQPIPISIGLKSDRKPSVRVRSSGVGPRITPNAMIPLAVEARDDYGLVDLGLAVKRERTGGDDAGPKDFDPVKLHEDELAELREVRTKQELEIDQFGVRPTDLIRVTGVATDDQYTGRQTGSSTTLTYRIVTHKELFREIIARQQQARAAFRQAIEDSKDVETVLRKAESGAEASGQARRFRTIQRAVWKVSRELERSAEEMRLNRLGGNKEDGNQAYESMKATILAPLAKLHDQSMANQRDALEGAAGLNEEGVKALADQQKALVAEMNALLSRMDRWDELLDAINQLTEVIDQQEQLKEKLDELLDDQIDDLFD